MGQLAGPTDPAADARWTDPKPRKGFFTDTSICIGCKACEVACKEWNHNPRDRDLELLGSSYDNTGALGASTWRHVAFIEQGRERIDQARETGRALVSLGMPGLVRAGRGGPGCCQWTAPPDTAEFRWLMSSDVCKHCTHAGCLDVCPLARCSAPSSAPSWCKPMSATGAAPAWPAVRSASSSAAATARPPRRASAVSGEANNPRFPILGIAQKCTLCYDRLVEGRHRRARRPARPRPSSTATGTNWSPRPRNGSPSCMLKGMTEARLYGANDLDGVGGTGSVFLRFVRAASSV